MSDEAVLLDVLTHGRRAIRAAKQKDAFLRDEVAQSDWQVFPRITRIKCQRSEVGRQKFRVNSRVSWAAFSVSWRTRQWLWRRRAWNFCRPCHRYGPCLPRSRGRWRIPNAPPCPLL